MHLNHTHDFTKQRAAFHLLKYCLRKYSLTWFISLSTIILAVSAYPSSAQNSSSSGARVIYQSSNGLAYPSSSYIGPGTLSKTAQEGAGYAIPKANNGLPKVNRGSYFGTPGDNLYSGNPDLAQHPKTIYSRGSGRIIYKQTAKETAKVYTPDPNIPLNYSNYEPDKSMQSENSTVTTKSENTSTPSGKDSHPAASRGN